MKNLIQVTNCNYLSLSTKSCHFFVTSVLVVHSQEINKVFSTETFILYMVFLPSFHLIAALGTISRKIKIKSSRASVSKSWNRWYNGGSNSFALPLFPVRLVASIPTITVPISARNSSKNCARVRHSRREWNGRGRVCLENRMGRTEAFFLSLFRCSSHCRTVALCRERTLRLMSRN